MNNLEQLVKTTLEELRRLAGAETVVGAPIQVEGAVVIPLLKLRAGFGAGGGSGTQGAKGDTGSGGGAGGGVDVQPVAVLIADASGIRLEPVAGRPPAKPDTAGKIIDALKSVLARRNKDTAGTPSG